MGNHPTTQPPPIPSPFRMRVGRLAIRATTGQPFCCPNDESLDLSAYKIKARTFPSAGIALCRTLCYIRIDVWYTRTCISQNLFAVHGSSMKHTNDLPSNFDKRWASKTKCGPTWGSLNKLHAQSHNDQWCTGNVSASGTSTGWTVISIWVN